MRGKEVVGEVEVAPGLDFGEDFMVTGDMGERGEGEGVTAGGEEGT